MEEPQREPPIPYATPNPVARRRAVLAVGILTAAACIAAVFLGIMLSRGYKVTIGVTPPTPPLPTTAPTGPAPIPRPPPTPPPPPMLVLPDEPPRFRITQHHTGTIPGSGGTIEVHVRDITGGKVLVEVEADDGQNLASGTLRPGDALSLSVDGKGYVVVVAGFILRLTGNDVGIFVIRRAEDPLTPEERIGQFIDAVDKTKAVVTDPKNQSVGAYLRGVWQLRHASIQTPQDLIDAVGASEGSPRVRVSDGTETELGSWLSEELAKQKQPSAPGN